MSDHAARSRGCVRSVPGRPPTPPAGFAVHPVDAAQHPVDATKHPVDAAQHPADAAQHPVWRAGRRSTMRASRIGIASVRASRRSPRAAVPVGVPPCRSPGRLCEYRGGSASVRSTVHASGRRPTRHPGGCANARRTARPPPGGRASSRSAMRERVGRPSARRRFRACLARAPGTRPPPSLGFAPCAMGGDLRHTRLRAPPAREARAAPPLAAPRDRPPLPHT